MARPRSTSPQRKGKGTSFGKKSDAEKTFRKRKFSSRSGRLDASPSSSPNGNRSGDDFRRNNEGPSKAPFRRIPGTPYGSDKGDIRKPFRPRPDREDSRDKKPFGKREGGSFSAKQGSAARYKRPYRSEGDRKKRSYRSDGNTEKKPYRKSDSPSIGPRAKKPYPKTEGFSKPPRTKDHDDRPDQDQEKKPFQKKERKSFVQSRVVTSADFTKPGRKPEPTIETPIKDDGLTRLNK